MKLIFVFTCLILAGWSYGTVLSDAAASMAPGDWKRLETNGYGQSLIDACDGVHSIFEWSNKAVWNESTGQFLYVGQGHYSCMKFISYRAATNSWRTLSNPPDGKGVNHSYDNNCTDGQNLYYMYYHGKTIYKYNIAGNSWSTLTTAPDNLYIASQPAVALDYYPELGGLVLCAGDNNHVALYHLSSNTWESLAPPSNDYGDYSVMAQYNPVQKVLVYGGPGAVYRIDPDKTVTKLTTAPALLRVDGNCKFTHDPTGGKFLLFSRDEFYEFDALKDEWTFRPEGADSLFSHMRSWGVMTPIPSLGVIMFTLWNFDQSSVWLYKHDPNVIKDQKLTTIALSPKVITIENGGSVQFSALGKDQYDHDFDDTFNFQVDGGGTITNAVFTSNNTPGDFTVTASGASDNTVTATAAVSVLDTSLGIVTLVDFGKTAGSDIFGIAGWDSVTMDKYMDNVDVGPGGTKMTTGGTGGYNHQSVSGPAREFKEGEIILVTWYNEVDSSTTFTPTLSFDDPDRPAMGATGTWHAMNQLTIPPKSTSETRLVITAGLAGSYSLVSVSHAHPNGGHILCDKIELITDADGSLVEEKVSGRIPANALFMQPNPFNSMVKIRVMSDAISVKRVNPQVMVYNINGKQVADLTHHASRITPYLFIWNASHFPNGIYFIKANVNGKIYTKQLFLIK
jgi:hypothetical protein